MEVKVERAITERPGDGRSESIVRSVMRDPRLLKFIADHLGTIFFKLDAAGRLELFGPPLERMIGYRIEEITDYAGLIHPEDQPMVIQAHTQLEDNKEIDLAFRVTHRNGSQIWLHERVTGTDGAAPGRRTYYGYIKDITAQLALEGKEKERSRKMHRLNRLLAELNECTELGDVLFRATRAAIEDFDCRYAEIVMVDNAGEAVSLGHRSVTDELKGAVDGLLPGPRTIKLAELGEADNLLARAIQSPRTYSTKSLYDLARPMMNESRCRQLTAEHGIEHFLVLPAQAQGQVVALLVVGREIGFDDPGIDMLENFSRQLATIIGTLTLIRESSAGRRGMDLLLESIDEPLAVMGIDGALRKGNASYLRLWQGVLPQAQSCQENDRCTGCKLGVVVRSGSGRVSEVRLVNGSYFSCRLFPVIENGRVTSVIQHLRDLSPIMKSEQFAARLLHQQAILDTVIKAVSRRLDAEDIMNRALKEILRALKMDAGVSFVDREGTLRLVAAQGLAPAALRYLGRWPRPANLAAAGVGEANEVVVLTRDGPGRQFKRLFAQGLAANRIVLVPLACDGRVRALLMLGASGDVTFTEEDKILAGLIAQEVMVALDNARLYQETKRSQLMLKRLATNLLRTEDEVKRRLARELHDQVGHTLASAKITLGLLKKDLRQEKKGVRELIGDVEDSIDESIKASRQMIYDMYPAALEDVGLAAFMESYADGFRRRTGIELELRLSVARRLPVATENVIFRLVQEALNNMAKHSGSSKGRLSIDATEGGVRISVVDWGRGFNQNRVLLRRGATGIGLSAMGERVESIGGQMTISSKTGKGTEVSISLPGRYPRKKGQ